MNDDLTIAKSESLSKNIGCPELIPLFDRHNAFSCGISQGKRPMMDIQLSKAAVTERYQTCKPLFGHDPPTSPCRHRGAVCPRTLRPLLRKSGYRPFWFQRKSDAVKSALGARIYLGKFVRGSVVPFTRRELLFQTA